MSEINIPVPPEDANLQQQYCMDQFGMYRFVTKDSGQRDHFSSGMVRDTQEGKPRLDLVWDGPLARVIMLMSNDPEKGSAIDAMFNWYESPSVINAALAVIEIAKLEGGVFVFMGRCAALMARGAIKYAARNWMLASGQPELERFTTSACRHFSQYLSGDVTEDHSAATWFNLNGAEYVRSKLNSTAESLQDIRQG